MNDPDFVYLVNKSVYILPPSFAPKKTSEMEAT